MKAPRTWLVVASYGMMESKAEEMYNINIEGEIMGEGVVW